MTYQVIAIKKEGYKAEGYMVVNMNTNQAEKCIDGSVWVTKVKKHASSFAGQLNSK
jgi:hypothetical protein